jgi:AraC family transcriptional regulator, regulatory protein of adaptative response / methylated-DNA-[protein]-cysteine methyltransferase
LESLKESLRQTKNLIQAAEGVGLSSQSRVYDLYVTLEAMTPGEYRSEGQGIDISCGMHDTPFGTCFIAITTRGICSMEFTNESLQQCIAHLQHKWSYANIKGDHDITGACVRDIFHTNSPAIVNKLFVIGTPFQVKVWEALLNIPFGAVASYQHIAALAGAPKASRATGSAISHNPVAFLIPCHRVIRNEGIIGNYRWNPIRKCALIGWEKAFKASSGQ